MCNDNYIIVPLKYAKEYNLKGNELLVFSLIFGFSQDGESVFQGSIRYITESLGLGKATVLRILEGLVETGCIEKIDKKVNGVKFCMYKAVLLEDRKNEEKHTEDEGWSQNDTSGIKMIPPVSKRDGGGIKMIPNNIDNNIDISLPSARARAQDYSEFMARFFRKENRAQLEKLCMDNHIKPEELLETAKEIINEWELTEVRHTGYSDTSQHLINVLRKKIKANVNTNGRTDTTREERLQGLQRVWNYFDTEEKSPDLPF